jgi:hypothetical protein
MNCVFFGKVKISNYTIHDFEGIDFGKNTAQNYLLFGLSGYSRVMWYKCSFNVKIVD